ncbi:ATP synthase (F/14-kDa) subunit-domain-containing protein [Suillus clintonianus]|uniref:ATP synthase (F/14-kDa) subunit-domain-containing protein n=1 Tax=Suillus clintonianus TaxID=1904413 RepID=UPI001B873AFC|nr:ATP synthase (F/14-kDa) subunit-domain-containing protein [Suillus clintonianus]KAG2155459.1 ATP synthase (F/14-kDa) subunit-domain-containing protein [Suillus clintonianus]
MVGVVFVSEGDPDSFPFLVHRRAPMASTTAFKDRNLIAVIGDEDSITGLLLAGIGHINEHQRKNFLVVDSSKVFGVFPVIACSEMSPETQISSIEAAFQEFTQRKDIAIVLINQHIAEKIRPTVDRYQEAFPTLLEIPSKDHPYGEHRTHLHSPCNLH